MMKMNKESFLSALRSRLAGLPQEDVEERLNFYAEMIEDRMEEGLSEEEAVAEVGSVDEIAAQILGDIPLSKIVKNKMPKRRLQAWEIVLLVLGFPVWFPLLIAGVAVVFSLYIIIWAVIVSLWAAFVAVLVSAFALIIVGVWSAISVSAPAGIAVVGTGIFGVGLAIFLCFGCVAATKGMAILTKKIGLGLKKCLIRKEHA
jgi:uncharacterized membrane protein